MCVFCHGDSHTSVEIFFVLVSKIRSGPVHLEGYRAAGSE